MNIDSGNAQIRARRRSGCTLSGVHNQRSTFITAFRADGVLISGGGVTATVVNEFRGGRVLLDANDPPGAERG